MLSNTMEIAQDMKKIYVRPQMKLLSLRPMALATASPYSFESNSGIVTNELGSREDHFFDDDDDE